MTRSTRIRLCFAALWALACMEIGAVLSVVR